MKPRALLLSGYNAISQATWADFVQAHCSNYDWQVLALPPRYFSWRMRGAPLSFAALEESALHESYDLIVATSSVDLATVQSIYPQLRNVFSILYFHENQFAYPASQQPQSVVDWQMVSLYSALRADKILFNSPYNQHSFLNGLRQLLKKLPDLVPSYLVENIAAKSSILPVPIPTVVKTERPMNEPWTLLWNHRWEWDKQPELLLTFLKKLQQSDLGFQLIITGQKFRRIPEAMSTLQSTFKKELRHFGFVESRADYEALLQQSDIVVSTANHEFQGIAVMEAVANGAIPLLPNALSYPDFFNPAYLFEVSESHDQTAQAMINKLLSWKVNGLPTVPDIAAYSETNLVNQYRRELKVPRP